MKWQPLVQASQWRQLITTPTKHSINTTTLELGFDSAGSESRPTSDIAAAGIHKDISQFKPSRDFLDNFVDPGVA